MPTKRCKLNMQHFSNLTHLRAALTSNRLNGRSLAFVPTMGNLHAGHLKLIEVAKDMADSVAVSIFVNPLQFDREDDLTAYPRTLDQDLRELASLEVNFVLTPSEMLMYPHGRAHTTTVHVPGLSEILEGQHRPGHFIGVATVVCKLLNIVRPDLALFGEKDYQQLLVIRQMVADLNLGIDIRGVPTVREADGLALSSRNGYLNPRERRLAPNLYRILQTLAEQVQAGEASLTRLTDHAASELARIGFQPEYVSLRRSQDLALAQESDRDLIILAAAWLGKARLIDNLRVLRDDPHKS